jgi:ATP-binding cassette, subfamily C (CFTR/MRP), member 1
MVTMSPKCPDDSFGPALDDPNCREFDFTLLFEQSILSLLPALIFAVAAPARFAFLARKKSKTAAGPARLAKLVDLYVPVLFDAEKLID